MTAVEVPPLGERLKYYLIALPPDERFRQWVERDVASLGSELRNAAHMFVGYFVGTLLAARVMDKSATPFLFGASFGLSIVTVVHLFGPLRRRSQRRRLRSYERRWSKRKERTLGSARET